MRRPLGRLRIIGGEYRSRLIDFDADAGVRPTPDRVRQTVFDWLNLVIDGSSVLDLFAGSGALGLEAVSRGAAQASFVETGAKQAEDIRSAIAKLGAAARCEVIRGDGIGFLRSTMNRFEVVFVDPPYDSPLLASTLANLPRVLKEMNRIYLEWPKGKPPVLPAGYSLLKEKAAGQVSYGLFTYAPPGEQPP
ncbi:16S rRNA (guanine(966)-N(2))-methyltransferase RsmD [Nevskia sp.]|uniref:16S rRNA (guanine(966)-N(2))-methyltransferase RsmD n=1 Tax=Nevskia sp. TaxID=1929292 RepID=UPI0025FCEA95|nr:16S rRNA (guanine(966)-N(2))-methyltransferase RsmD [Nevskia sp.]